MRDAKEKRESRYVQYARLTYRLTTMVLPAYRHRNRPHTYTQPQLVAAVFLGFYVQRSYRDLEEWLLASEPICAVLEFEQVPHYSTLCRSFQQLPMAQLHLRMRQSLRWLGVSERAMVVDSTGLMARHASQHYLSRSGRNMSQYPQAFYVVGVESQYSVCWYTARGSKWFGLAVSGSVAKRGPSLCDEGRQTTGVGFVRRQRL